MLLPYVIVSSVFLAVLLFFIPKEDINLPEMKNIEQLKQIIDDYTDSKTNSIKIVMLKEFSKGLETILSKYKVSIENENYIENNI